MIKLSGKNWHGELDLEKGQARGVVNGCSWLLTCTAKSWVFEIAEDLAIGADELPLVGFGCAGWLAEHELEAEVSQANIAHFLEARFQEFTQNALQYHPTVNCTCSD